MLVHVCLVCAYARMRVLPFQCMHRCVYVCIHVLYLPLYQYILRVCMHMRMYVCLLYCVYSCMYVLAGIFRCQIWLTCWHVLAYMKWDVCTCSSFICMCTSTHVCVYIHTCVRVCVCMKLYKYIYMYVYIYSYGHAAYISHAVFHFLVPISKKQCACRRHTLYNKHMNAWIIRFEHAPFCQHTPIYTTHRSMMRRHESSALNNTHLFAHLPLCKHTNRSMMWLSRRMRKTQNFGGNFGG